MVRLFVGSFLQEDEAARIDHFGESNEERLRGLTSSSIRFVTAPNLHITWVFLGEVAEEKLNGIKELLRREVEFLKTGIGVEDGPIPADRPTKKYSSDGLGKKISIEFEYDYLEAWPQVTEARVLVATPTVVPDAVLKIGMALRRSMADQGLTDKAEPRNRLFRPHLTIARFNPAISFGDGKMLAAISEVLPVRHKIDRINLIKSHLGQGPGDYEIIDTVR